ncbi:tRNA-dihydrouridine synthase A [Dinoroseobacter shibae DFL 12 = DSM 16493]|uniref:tRNA-dihydrouridine(20/20a) synthase n=1 Tax=Dinoroseobacter shibae (strain DSM 16493 / NCIMB 14021 / DFL 12) TaxID=398580 RepID=A8LSP6_DINSH|nr:tRNA dihydrouridine(20/20a) synthase DusA [Dinoroseobacter shibae]ABV94245.1 tRNA-dihydrouridine synthase A [Dinoroseobacter shibae DFL 12 = DSM 16493]
MISEEKSNSCGSSRLSVAPMMDWTDRHCRMFHRQFTQHALLYTEMVTAPAVVRGDAGRLLEHAEAEHPLALQLGGSDPVELAEAVRIACGHGFDEINLNVGCPSDRVQSGCFGAVLMEQPALVARCVAAMIAASDGPEITVKCRIGVDDQQPEEMLPGFLRTVSEAGVRRFTIHARKAWLQGLSPKENRDIPPLDYPLVVRMKQAFPGLHLSINGGITDLDQAAAHLASGLDGVMIGRAAYHEPARVLGDADRRFFGGAETVSAETAVEAMRPYIADHLARGGKLAQITRHMLGAFAGRPGARGWRRVLSEEGHRPEAGLGTLDRALAHIAGPHRLAG